MFVRPLALVIVSAAAIAFGFAGCNGPAPSTDDHSHDDHGHEGHDHGHEGHDHADHKDDHSSTGHTHGEWWCGEHGVPEGECGLCSREVAAALKKKGDWCEDHNRPDSQCFVCHPELEAKFAARYEAKYGKAPPKN
ncbi:MAG TPA: RND transporter [Pirellulaceae bacterium]|nr:RND transporter [Pirellulaceae bacterium]